VLLYYIYIYIYERKKCIDLVRFLNPNKIKIIIKSTKTVESTTCEKRSLYEDVEDVLENNSGMRKKQDARENDKLAIFARVIRVIDALYQNAGHSSSPRAQFPENVRALDRKIRALTNNFHVLTSESEGSPKNHFWGQGFIVPSGVLNIKPSRLRRGARTLVVMLPFL